MVPCSVIPRWVRYINESFADDRCEPPEIENLEEGTLFTKDEIRIGLKWMKQGKAVGPDKISIEMLQALEENGLDSLYKILNNVHSTGEIPEQFLQSISSHCQRSQEPIIVKITESKSKTVCFLQGMLS